MSVFMKLEDHFLEKFMQLTRIFDFLSIFHANNRIFPHWEYRIWIGVLKSYTIKRNMPLRHMLLSGIHYILVPCKFQNELYDKYGQDFNIKQDLWKKK